MGHYISLNDHLHDYMLSHSLREHSVLTKLRHVTAAHPYAVMQIAPEQGQFMGLLLKMIGAKTVLELGTFTGYSALSFALNLPNGGRVITIDCDPLVVDIGRPFWKEANVNHLIESLIGDGKELISKVLEREGEGSIDLIFLDADKESYDHYYEEGLKLLSPKGVMLVDNVFWSGLVADAQAQQPSTMALKALNRKIFSDNRVDISMLPLADGLFLVRKK